MNEQNCVYLHQVQEEFNQYTKLLQGKLTNLSVFELDKCKTEQWLLLKREKLQPERLTTSFRQLVVIRYDFCVCPY